MHRVPVKDVNTGKTTYYDVSFDFTLNPEKGLIFEQISSVAISPPLISTTNLVVGRYQDGSGHCYDLEAPTFFSDSRSLYIFKAVGCTESENWSFTAQIISGPAVEHPGIGHRSIVAHLPDTYVYGIINDTGYVHAKINTNWNSDEIIGLMQTGDNLSVALFTDDQDSHGNWNDFSIPVQTVILEKLELE